MDSNLQKQEIKKSFTFDTQKKTDLYDGIFSTSLYKVEQQEEKKKDYKEYINELREREKLMGVNNATRTTVSEKTVEKEKSARAKALERVSEFKKINEKMTDLEGTETSKRFYENVEDEEKAFSSKMSAFDAKKLLQNASYKVKGKKAKKTKHSPSMQAVIDRFNELEQVLGWKVGQSEELFNAQMNSIRSVLKLASLACSDYLGTHNSSRAEGMARKALVQLMYDQVSKESVLFEKRAKEFRKANGTDERPMWLDVFADIRREKIVPGENVKITRGGAGTSDLIIVEKDGVKHFLKREEKMPGFSGDEVYISLQESLLERKKLYEEGTSESLKDIPEAERQERVKLITMQTVILQNFRDALIECAPVGINGIPDSMSSTSANLLTRHIRTMIKSPEAFYKKMMDKPYKSTTIGRYIVDINEKVIEAQKAKDEDTVSRYMNMARMAYDVADNYYKSLNASEIATKAVGIEAEDSLSKRNVATTRLAEFLNIGHLMAKSEMKDVQIDGEYHRCIEMEDAGANFTSKYEKMENNHYKKGDAGSDGNEGKVFSYSEECLRDMFSMQVFDVIGGQTDRHPGNYSADAEITDTDVTMKKVKGIDNDMAFGTLSYNRILSRDNVMKATPIEDTKGNFTLPAMDAKLAARILAVTPSMLDYLMADLLNKKERDALKSRFKGVQDAIRRQKTKEAKLKLKGKKFTSKFINTTEEWAAVKADLQKKARTHKGRQQIEHNTYLKALWMGNKIEKVKDINGKTGLRGIYD